MTEKWKEFAKITGLGVACTVGELAWTGFLISTVSKIPYVKIPAATVLGITGMFGTLWFVNAGKFAFKDWYKEYYTK